MKRILINSIIVVLLSSTLVSCSDWGYGIREYAIENNTEDTIFYGHAYMFLNTSIINTSPQNDMMEVKVVDTIPPHSQFFFATTKIKQRADVKKYGLAFAEDGTVMNINDSGSYYLEYKGRKYYIDATDRESFFFTDNYEYQQIGSYYVFYLREYLEKLEARE